MATLLASKTRSWSLPFLNLIDATYKADFFVRRMSGNCFERSVTFTEFRQKAGTEHNQELAK